MTSSTGTIRFVDRDAGDLDELIARLEAPGPCDIVAGGRSKAAAIERFAETLRFPDWSGHNLDALYELLDEHAYKATSSGRAWTLLWLPRRRLIRRRPDDYRGIVSVLRDVARAGPPDPARGARLIVVRGPDPTLSTSEEPS